jgi:two-component system, sporulation sensor kinase E
MKSGFIDKLIERLDRVAPDEVQSHLQRLMEEKGLLESVFQALQEGVLLTDPAGCITYVNAAACRLFGMDESAVGQRLSAKVRGLDWEAMAGGGRIVSRDLEVFYPENRYLNFYVAPILPRGAGAPPAGHVMLVRDITQSRRQDEEKIESERLGALTLLAAGVAHELGNPLNSLTIHLQLLDRRLKARDPVLHDELGPMIETARGELRRLDFIIEQFLGAVRPSQPQLETCDLNGIIREAAGFLAAEFKDRGVVLELQLHSRLPDLALDPGQMKQALYNVLRNAAQAVKGEGGRVLVRSDFDDLGVRVLVSDNGGGISAVDMGRLFTPYFTTRAGGHGLGLLIVRRIVREHGGDIRIESTEGEGTVVTFHLPFARPRVRLLADGTGADRVPARKVPARRKPARGAPEVIDLE